MFGDGIMVFAHSGLHLSQSIHTQCIKQSTQSSPNPSPSPKNIHKLIISSMNSISVPASPKKHRKYVMITDFGDAGGHNNKGISLVRNTKTGEKLIRKRVLAQKSKDELTVCQRLNGFEYIVQLRDHILPSKSQADPSSGESTALRELYFEHCDLGSLNDLLKRHEIAQQRIPESFVWHVLVSIGRALQACHAGPAPKGRKWIPIAHRDVMAGNILFSSSSPGFDMSTPPRVLLSDFGASIEYQSPDPIMQRKDISDLAETIYGMCYCAWDVETAQLGYSAELQGVLAVMDVYWEDTPEHAAEFNSGFVSWVEEERNQATLAEFGGQLVWSS
ncbi:unnamed protein product [Periconia digitata]|uniref:non-specific serine/threonine protein kinase n=1 Tax=Periconia digitata TaxID=1303443 RepID=A0A9W4UFM3_9PLEO|nr:unnamed protein product [Periconia digitata]